ERPSGYGSRKIARSFRPPRLDSLCAAGDLIRRRDRITGFGQHLRDRGIGIEVHLLVMLGRAVRADREYGTGGTEFVDGDLRRGLSQYVRERENPRGETRDRIAGIDAERELRAEVDATIAVGRIVDDVLGEHL